MAGCSVGDRINNYLLEELIGTGSFGQVWRAKHHIFDERVAIKTPTDPQYVNNLRCEGVAIHGLRHENIVRALDLDPYADPPYVIFEFVDGPTLRQIIDRHPRGLPEVPALEILKGLLSALSVAHHAGIVHRDIKPANILLAIGDGDASSIKRGDVKVTDFGLGTVGGLTTASIVQSVNLDGDSGGSISGTIAYMSPEQRDGEPVDLRSDLYSCGIVLFEMLTGVRPQGHDLPSHIRQHLPVKYDEIFKKCYTRLDKRYSTAPEILADLDHAFAKNRTIAASAAPIPRLGHAPESLLCLSCGKSVDAADRFCIHCGKPTVDEIVKCPTAGCDGHVETSDNFCITCGVDLRVESGG
jgi:serine/threonine-protein kinase